MTGFKALDLATQLYKECEKLNLKNPMRDQLLRASLSIPLNITEGSGRRTIRDKKRFYTIALGSIRECQCIVKMIEHSSLIASYDKLGALVYGLTRK